MNDFRISRNNSSNIFKNIVKRSKLFVFAGLVGMGLIVSTTGCLKNESRNVDSNVGVDQLNLPQTNEQIAILTVKNYGEIKIRLFDNAAPRTVKNFIKLSKEGKYDGALFDEVVADFSIHCNADNDEVEAIKKSECSKGLHSYNGAVCAVKSHDSNGKELGQNGQFYIIYSEDGKMADFDYLENNQDTYREGQVDSKKPKVKFSDSVRENYRTHGGFPISELQQNDCIFGQVFEGLDIVEKIANCPKSEENMFGDPQPIDRIEVEHIEIKPFEGVKAAHQVKQRDEKAELKNKG